MNLELLKDISLINPSKAKQSELKEKIFSLLKQEFNENIFNIKLIQEIDYMKRLKLSFTNLYKSFFPNELLENDIFFIALQEAEKRIYEECYKPILGEINKVLAVYDKKYKTKSIDGLTLLTSFHKHCDRNCIAYHQCKDLGRFINVYVSLSIEYVICSKCLLVYRKEFIPMYCDACKVDFYSSSQTTIEQRCYPATWSQYHCNGVIPKQMRCTDCNSKFWLSKGNFLCCKQCKSFNLPSEIKWKCNVCLSDFTIKDNEIKEFNLVEAILIKRAIKAAIIAKQPGIPIQLGCNCNNDKNQEVTYSHSKDCLGSLYIGQLNGCNILVCNKCFRYFGAKDFNWICSCCNGEFVSSTANNSNCNFNWNGNSNGSSGHKNSNDDINKRNRNSVIIDLNQYSINSPSSKEEREKNWEVNAYNNNIADFFEPSTSKALTYSNDKSLSKQTYDFCTPRKLFINSTPIKSNFNTRFSVINTSNNKISINLNNSTSLDNLNVNKYKNKENVNEYQVIVPKKMKKIPIAIDSNSYRQIAYNLDKEEILDKQRRTFIPKQENKENKENKEGINLEIAFETISIDKYIVETEIDSTMNSFIVYDQLGKHYTLRVYQNGNTSKVEKLLKELDSIQDGSLVTVIGKNKQKNKIYVLLEHIESTLDLEIVNMSHSKLFYTQIELQSMIYSLINGLIFAQKYKIDLLELCPQNIMKTNLTYKLLPEQFAIYNREQVHKGIDDELSQLKGGKIFKLVYWVLYASTMSLELSKDIIATEDFNERLIKLHSNLRQRYKPEFINSLGYILNVNEKNDLTMKALEDMASLFELD